MTKKQKINNVRSIYESVSGKQMEETHANYLYQSLSCFRKVKDIFADDENGILTDAFEFLIESNFAYYPLDVIELRLYLAENKISCQVDTLFSYKFVRKYCYDYPLLLCLDVSKSSMKRYGGVIMDEDNIDLSECIRRLYISPKLQKETIANILDTVKELCPKIDIVLDLKVPGTFNAKLASKQQKYIVDLPQLDFKSEITTSEGEHQAVIDAVNKAWRSHREKNGIEDNRNRPSHYLPSYWLNFSRDSTMWQAIVKKK